MNRYAPVLVAAIALSACDKPSLGGATPAASSASASARGKPSAPPPEATCHLVPCHGAAVSCAPGPAEACTLSLEAGDLCRGLARCVATDGGCALAPSRALAACQACIAACTDGGIDCDQACAKQLRDD